MITMSAVMGTLGTDVRLFGRPAIPAGTPWQLDPWTGELLLQGPDGWLGAIAYEAAEQRAWGILCQERERAATPDLPLE